MFLFQWRKTCQKKFKKMPLTIRNVFVRAFAYVLTRFRRASNSVKDERVDPDLAFVVSNVIFGE